MSLKRVTGDRAGVLLSVNVGVPREVEWQGKIVRTAIWKESVAGPRMVRRLNIDGDDQADRAAHGGEHRAVFVYQIESYRYWERELGRADFTDGQFGENFTVKGLGDDEVCIGDRYQIGEAIFEVTQPRVTCFRVGIRMAEPRMPSLLVSHHRPGFYFRVIDEGRVEAGDAIIRVHADPAEVTVADVDGLLYLPKRSRRTLKRALRVSALSEGWKGSFRDLLEQDEQQAGAPAAPAWEGFQPLTVTAVARESSTIVSVSLAASNGEAVGRPAPGQYLTLRLAPEGADKAAIVRSYSLSSVAERGEFRISVKLEPGGEGSTFIHEHIRPGDTVDVAAPRGTFVLRDSDHPVVLVSAGVGATPVLAMLHALAAAGDGRDVWWIHGARNSTEDAFGREVDALLAALPNAHRIVAYSRPGPGDQPGAAFDVTGRITIETIGSAGIPEGAAYYLCGPEAFMRDLSAGLAAGGTAPERISMETFGAVDATAPGIVGTRPAPHHPAGPPGAGPAITFSRSNLTVAWDAGCDSLLEFAEACDVPVGFGCRTGVCHSCETGVLAGEVEYVIPPLEDPEPGRVLVCCAKPRAELTLDL